MDTILSRLEGDTQAEINGILDDARAEAERIGAGFAAQASATAADLSAKNEKNAAEREERLISVANMEARKAALAAKQDMVEQAFALALERLCKLPDEQYIAIAADLMVRAAHTGRESVIFSAPDRERIGKAAVARANELLAKENAPQRPKADTKVGELLNSVATGVAALLDGTALLTLSKETRDIPGGFILADGDVEVNCAFPTLVRLQRNEIAGEVAKLLFA
ncbi:MAG: V-type ATP synthase subunit E [Oscillospiraceae bacterium]